MNYELRPVYYDRQRWAVVVIDNNVERIRRIDENGQRPVIWRRGEEVTPEILAIAQRSVGK